MIAGTPIHASIDDRTVTVLITSSGDGSISISFDADSDEEARNCYEMWSNIVDMAVDAEGNEYWNEDYDV